MHCAADEVRAERGNTTTLGKAHVFPSLLTAARCIKKGKLQEAGRALVACGKWELWHNLLYPQHAAELLGFILKAARKTAQAETLEEQRFLDSLPENAPDLPARRKINQRRFDNLLPGTKSGIHTLQHEGQLLTDPEEIDRALCEYWGKVFAEPKLQDNHRNGREKMSE